MKKILSFICILGLVFTFNACKKDTSGGNTLEKGYFTIQGATFVSGNMPAAAVNSPQITNTSGNSQVLAGGSSPISIETNSAAAYALVGIQGQSGYYKIPVTTLKSTNSVYLIYLLFSQTLTSTSFTIVISVMDDGGLVSESSTISVTEHAAGTGKLQVSISWDKLNDVDLHLVEPNGEEIYYSNDYSANGGILDVDSNPDCTIDGINNENITYNKETAIVEAGKYIVRADFYSNCDITENTTYVVTARYNGNLIQPSSGTNPYHGTFIPADADQGIQGDGFEVMQFNIAEAKAASPAKTLHFVYHGNRNKVLSPGKFEKSKKK